MKSIVTVLDFDLAGCAGIQQGANQNRPSEAILVIRFDVNTAKTQTRVVAKKRELINKLPATISLSCLLREQDGEKKLSEQTMYSLAIGSHPSVRNCNSIIRHRSTPYCLYDNERTVQATTLLIPDFNAHCLATISGNAVSIAASKRSPSLGYTETSYRRSGVPTRTRIYKNFYTHGQRERK